MQEKNRAYLPQNCKREPLELVISERFCDESGKAAVWRINPISAADVQAMYREGVVPASAGLRLLAASVSEPDLCSVELQNAYGVMGADQLLLKMLSPAEFAKLERAFAELNL